jgi:hypothetical protein
MNYGRERGVGRALGVGVTRCTGVGVEVSVAIGVGVGIGVGLGVTGTIASARVSPLGTPMPTMTPSLLIPSADDEVFIDRPQSEFGGMRWARRRGLFHHKETESRTLTNRFPPQPVTAAKNASDLPSKAEPARCRGFMLCA